MLLLWSRSWISFVLRIGSVAQVSLHRAALSSLWVLYRTRTKLMTTVAVVAAEVTLLTLLLLLLQRYQRCALVGFTL
jgi:hypothetical protein